MRRGEDKDEFQQGRFHGLKSEDQFNVREILLEELVGATIRPQ